MEDELSKNRGGSDCFDASDVTPEAVGSLVFPLPTKDVKHVFQNNNVLSSLVNIHVSLNCIT